MNSLRLLLLPLLMSITAAAIGQDPDVSIPSIPSGTEVVPALPPVDVKGSAEVLEGSLFAGEPFQYRLKLSWQGSTDFLSLAPPVVSWPGGLTQVDVSQSVRTEAGAEGPVGVKTFTYSLLPERATDFKLPSIQIDLNRPGGQSQRVEIPGIEVTVANRPPTLGEQARKSLRENRFLAIGGALVVAVGLFVFFLSRRNRTSTDEIPSIDPWKNVESGLKNVEALLSSGESRSFYSSIESVLRSGLSILTGIDERDLARYLESDRLPTAVSDELKPLVSEIQDRKFRPDRPRPEEMARACRRLKAVLAAMKANEGGKTP